MKEELVNNKFRGGTLAPGNSMSGYLFYDSGLKRYYELQVDYGFEEFIGGSIKLLDASLLLEGMSRLS